MRESGVEGSVVAVGINLKNGTWEGCFYYC